MKLSRFLPCVAFVVSMFMVPASNAMQAPAAAPATDKSKAPKSVPAASSAPSAQEISDATAKGMVWVNTSTKVYHKPGGPSYGTTKHGKFMTEADATKAGFRAAKEPMAKKAKAAK